MRYFKLHWPESRGDELDSWGTSTWLFEVDEQGYPVRQVEVYSNGHILTYDHAHLTDQYGMLGDQPLVFADVAEHEIHASDFEEAWSTLRPLNR